MRADSALVIFSGGLDSTVCLEWARRKFRRVEAISFDYGQRNKIELSCARKIAKRLGIAHSVLPLKFFGQLCPNAVTYENMGFSADQGLGGRPSTYMPGRNSLFLSIAVAYGVPRNIRDYVIGTSEVDGTLKPDCREIFMESFEETSSLGVDERLSVHRPLETLSKGEVFALADELKCLRSVLKNTHTCFRGVRRVLHPWGYGCGSCTSCEVRKYGYTQFLERSKIRGAFSRVKRQLAAPLPRRGLTTGRTIVSAGRILEKRLDGVLPGAIPVEVRDALLVWAKTVENDGLAATRRLPLYRDRAFGGKHRAIRISPDHFLVYEIVSPREVTAVNLLEKAEWRIERS